ncbi:hypothetical protein ACP6JB_004270 [Aspergillus fumigatus]
MSGVRGRQAPIVMVIDFHHARSTEEFSYFTLRKKETEKAPATSLFGIACSRQLDSNLLINRPADVTRSTVQKAVVVITDTPQSVGQLREKLSVVTSAWFAQRDFSDIDILKKFREGLIISWEQNEGSKDQNLGLSLREMIHEFKYQTLVLFKALLLQPKGSMFGPYTPLQQLDLLADHGTKSYVVGSTNSLLLQQKDRYSDILINLDEDVITISSPSLRSALVLSTADRRWIDLLTQIINDTWDESHPQRPKDHGYMGSEEFIRLQFEEYLLALLSSMKYHEELHSCSSGESGQRSRAQLEAYNIEGDPALDFNPDFLAHWQTTSNYALFKRLTSDALLFSIVEPRHPCAGGLTIEDVQRRLSQQVAELHLDERVRESREALNRHLATGQKKVSAAFNSFWADIEAMREAQRKRNEERALQSQRSSMDQPRPSLDTASVTSATGSWFGGRKAPTVDIAQAQASVNAVSQKASAYLSSWSSWASEKRKEWQEKKATPSSPSSITSPSTPTLSSIVEDDDPERGRRRSMQQQRQSEDSSANLSRSGSRRKRWSNILLRRESGDFEPPNAKEDSSPDSSEQCQPYPKSPLSRGTSVGEGDVVQSTQPKSIEPSTESPVKKEPETSRISDIVEKQQLADEEIADGSGSHRSSDKALSASAEPASPSTSTSKSN